jgi:CRISPR-associated protein Csb1
MANRLEATCWNEADNKPVDALAGISHVTVTRGKNKDFMTDSMLEAHRLNSPYLLEGKDKTFFDTIKKDLGGLAEGPINRAQLSKTLLKYDVGSLIHGVFLAKKDLAGGRLRVARALSAFIEASNTQIAASGGVKNDHVNPSGDTGKGFGNVPFARDEFTAESIECHINLDLSQIRGYGLGEDATEMLFLLSLYKVRKLLDGDLRLRTACDLEPVDRNRITATRPDGFALPSLAELEAGLPDAIGKCKDMMQHTTVAFDDKLKKGKGDTGTSTSGDEEPTETETDED